MLVDYKPACREFSLNDDTCKFSIKGLSFGALSTLINHHLEDIEAIYKIVSGSIDPSGADFKSIAKSLICEAPGLAANIVALAADEPTSASVVEQMPFPLQVELLVAVGELTFTEVGGIKKFLDLMNCLIPKNQMETIHQKLKVK